MGKLRIGPTGSLVEGHVLDVNKKSFERALRDYDHLLYVKWNPRKLRGWGCWELRRHPAQKEVVDITEFKGMSFVKIGYHEVDHVHHVLDAAFLNYDQLRKLQEMDTTNTHGYASYMDWLEAKEKAHVQQVKEKALESRKYMGKQHRREIKEFKEMLLSGFNPHQIANYWDNAGSNKPKQGK